MKHIAKLGAATIILGFLFVGGCDMFDSLPINVPFSVPVAVSGSTNPLSADSSFCLDQYENFQEISDQVNTLTYLEGALRVDSVSSSNLTGNITVTLQNYLGQTLFTVVLNNVNPSNYINNPYIFPLTVAQVQALNQYVSSLENTCFSAYVEVVVTQGPAPYYVGAHIDMVFEAETDI